MCLIAVKYPNYVNINILVIRLSNQRYLKINNSKIQMLFECTLGVFLQLYQTILTISVRNNEVLIVSPQTNTMTLSPLLPLSLKPHPSL